VASSSASGNQLEYYDYATASLRAKATGGLDGTVKYIGDKGCRVVFKPAPGAAISVSMGVRLPNGKTAVIYIQVPNSGPSVLTGANNYVAMLGDQKIWQSGVPGGSARADVTSDGRVGTFSGHLVSAAGDVDLTGGKFTCG